MPVPVLVHRFFRSLNAGWAYHPSLERVYPALRDLLTGKSVGDAGPVGPIAVPGRDLVLCGMRELDPDRPADEFGRPLMVLRVALLHPDTVAAVHESLEKLPLPEAPGPDERLTLNQDGGPGPQDFAEPVAEVVELPKVVPSPSRRWWPAAVAIIVLCAGIAAWPLYSRFFRVEPNRPVTIEPTKPEQPIVNNTQNQSQIAILVTLENKLKGLDPGGTDPDWGPLIRRLIGSDDPKNTAGGPDYKPLVRDQVYASHVVEFLEKKATRYVDGIGNTNDAIKKLDDGFKDLDRLKVWWKQSEGQGDLITVNNVLVEGENHLRYDQFREALNKLIRSLATEVLSDETILNQINKINALYAYFRPRRDNVAKWARLGYNWVHLLESPDKLEFDIRSSHPLLKITKVAVWITDPVNGKPEAFPLELNPNGDGKYVLPDNSGCSFASFYIAVRIQLLSPPNGRLEDINSRWFIGKTTKSENPPDLSIGPFVLRCPELKVPMLPDYEEARAYFRDAKQNIPPVPTELPTRPNGRN